jgi:hypothetical protein
MAAVLAEVQALRAELAAVRSAVEAPRRPAERDEDSELLLEQINFEIGDAEFSCSSLIEHAQLDAAADLRLHLVRFFGGRPSPKRLGKWLSRMHRRGSVGRCVVDRFTTTVAPRGLAQRFAHERSSLTPALSM